MKKLLQKLACMSVIALACCAPAQGAPITLIATWSGLHFENTATATGRFVIERALLGNMFVGEVPEPGSLALFGIAFVGAAAKSRKKRHGIV